MAPTVHHTDGTAICGTNSAPYRWHSNVWHQQCTLHTAQQCMAPTVHRTDGTAMYGTISARCYGVTIRTAVFNYLYWLLLKTVQCCITWPSEHSTLCHCCTARCVQWHGGWAPRCRFSNIFEANIWKVRRNRRLWRWWCWGIFRNWSKVGLRCKGIRLRPACVMYCHLTVTVWRRAANELPQQFCTVSCSCVLTV